jgi:hypothetical protein
MNISNHAESTLPPKKAFLAAEQLDDLWDARGMKYRVDELHVMLLNRGLGTYIDRPKFRKMVRDILEQFLVRGEAKRQPEHEVRQSFPKVY